MAMEVQPRFEQDIGTLQSLVSQVQARFKVMEQKLTSIPNADEIYTRAVDAPMGKIRDTEMKVASNTIHIKDLIEKLT